MATSLISSIQHSAAYIDGGTGSLALQAALAAVLGIGVYVKMYWSRIRERFSRKPKTEAASAEHEA
jgi:hypothetical protein